MSIHYNLLIIFNKNYYKHYKYRNGPVPGIHCSHASKHSLRRPRNIGEKRNFCAIKSENEHYVKLRCKRDVNNLIDDYDDIVVFSRKNRSWKKYRKTRYK